MPSHLDITATRARLLEERRRLTELVDERDEAVDEAASDGWGELSDVDQHPADIGSETFEQEKERGLEADLRYQLSDVDDALRRLDAGTYGICATCGLPIEPERLGALPAARFCAADARRDERSRRTEP